MELNLPRNSFLLHEMCDVRLIIIRGAFDACMYVNNEVLYDCLVNRINCISRTNIVCNFPPHNRLPIKSNKRD